MAKGKREHGRPPAGGIVRNDYHRRNRKRNISTHCSSHGYQTSIPQGIRVVKRAAFESASLRQINERESAAFHGHIADQITEDDEVPAFFDSLGSLDQSRFLYLPPFLSPREVAERRFGANANDRWWEWEAEMGLESYEGRPRRIDG